MIKRLLYGFLVLTVALAVVEAAGYCRWLAEVDNVHSDIWHQVAGRRYQPGHAVIVAIDDQTRQEHQDEPLVFWAPYFARAIEVLRKAGARP